MTLWRPLSTTLGAYRVPDRNDYLALWREKNRDKTREAQQKYYAANKEKCVAAVQASRVKNPESSRAATRKFVAKHRDLVLERRRASYRANRANEIARVRTRKGKIQHGQLWTTPAEQVEIDGLYLFTQCFPWFEVDHVVPLNGKEVSGLHVVGNLQVITRTENRAKGNRFCPVEAEMVQHIRINT